mmetsp:Transcript_4490/g.19104  ORF Transcript_4490/g.19104 Transcript_4490/m.19104 type:complete len:221 (-) Transcript_4490:2202-2864(-)
MPAAMLSNHVPLARPMGRQRKSQPLAAPERATLAERAPPHLGQRQLRQRPLQLPLALVCRTCLQLRRGWWHDSMPLPTAWRRLPSLGCSGKWALPGRCSAVGRLAPFAAGASTRCFGETWRYGATKRACLERKRRCCEQPPSLRTTWRPSHRLRQPSLGGVGLCNQEACSPAIRQAGCLRSRVRQDPARLSRQPEFADLALQATLAGAACIHQPWGRRRA